MKEKVKEKMRREAKLKACNTLDKLDKTKRNGDEMGDKAIVEVETISSGSLGIDLALGVVDIQEEGLLKYTVQNHLEKNYFDTSCYCRSSKAGGIAAFIDAEHAFDRNYAEKLGLILKT
jgi:recombination protein RecA